MIAEARSLLRTHDSVLLQAPTGSGKTALAAYMLGSAASKNKRSWFLCHRAEILDQTALTFQKVGIPYGVIAAGHPLNPYMPVQLCSIDTLKSRPGRYQLPDLIVWDECHHVASAGWTRVKNANPQAKHVGLSATPERLDAKGLDDLFSAMVRGPSVAWLIENGFLCDYKAFAPPGPDMAAVHTRMGDFVKSESEAVMSKSTITGDAVRTYMQRARRKRAVAFCVSIKHSEHVAAEFRAAGIVAVHIDGSTPKPERQAAMKAFRNGDIQILTSVDIFGEGVDVPAIEAVILLRPTQSLSLYLQQVGRAFRPAEGKEFALILDHAGNIARHGLPDDERTWDLKGRKKRKAGAGDTGPPLRQCPKCYATHRPAPVCPECRHVYAVVGREIEHVDADLVEVDVEAARRRRVIENRSAESIADLVARGKERGYKKPIHWSCHYSISRKGKEATLNGLMEYATAQGERDPVKWAAKIMSQVMR